MAIVERFIALAGGPDAPTVVIPTADGREHCGAYWHGLLRFQEADVRGLTVLHTYDPKVADTESFMAPLRRARGAWFSGGQQWRLSDAYVHTRRVYRELRTLLELGRVIGGTSAGATIQASYLVRGDTKTNNIMMGDHEK